MHLLYSSCCSDGNSVFFLCDGLLATLRDRNTSIVIYLCRQKIYIVLWRDQSHASNPPCNSFAAPAFPRDVKAGNPSKRSVTLYWKKPLLYGDHVQMYTVIYFLFLFVSKLVDTWDTWENQSRFAKAGRARWYRYCCKQLPYCPLCCLQSQIVIGCYDLRVTNFITNFALPSCTSSSPGQVDLTKTTACHKQ